MADASADENVRVKTHIKSAKSRGASATPITRKTRLAKPPHAATMVPTKSASSNSGKRRPSMPPTRKL